MAPVKKVSFAHFLEKFPEIELPITLTDELVKDFSQNNSPFPLPMVEQFILPMEPEEMDEYTEFIPCFLLPATMDFYAIVYWRGGLMDYQYIMATYSKKGELIDRRVLAGTYSDGQALVRSVATIEDDWIIYVVSGKTAANDPTYDASTSNAFNLELLATGQIINSN